MIARDALGSDNPGMVNPLKLLQKVATKTPRALDELLVVPQPSLPAVVTAPPPVPALQQISRRDLLKRAAASTVSNAADLAPVGALAKLAAEPVAAKAVQSVVRVAPPLSPLDKAASESLWFQLGESMDLADNVDAWLPLVSQIAKDVTANERRRLMRMRSSVTNAPEDYDAVMDLFDALGPHIGKLPPEVVMKATGALSELTHPAQKRDWLKAVIDDAADAFDSPPSAGDIEATLRRLLPEP